MTPGTSQIITHNDPDRFPILEAKSQPINFPLSDLDLEIIEQMDVILTELGDTAAGLAAVQIGHPKQIFLLRKKGVNKAFINPEILYQSKEKRNRPEACLSLPGLGVKTKRPKTITLKYRDLHGEEQTETFNGFDAQCIGHEIDHLRAVLLTQHLNNEYKNMPRRTSFGMKMDKAAKKRIKRRRAKNKLTKHKNRS